ncbi:hypothetical protein H206_06965 [Candidatus Electrothrix aarhusensis]|uniref:Uncharacterized protein n=1 Tax=Candidatus Electrothrix aarhusensis TaxID=1859131 RepID=A0A3S4TCN3_9BACT|nr:hypothetical protein H206_06965 [Candidatus Electrothrix aarhusensis]
MYLGDNSTSCYTRIAYFELLAKSSILRLSYFPSHLLVSALMKGNFSMSTIFIINDKIQPPTL